MCLLAFMKKSAKNINTRTRAHTYRHTIEKQIKTIVMGIYAYMLVYYQWNECNIAKMLVDMVLFLEWWMVGGMSSKIIIDKNLL